MKAVERFAGAPARMLHDRGEKRNVVAYTFDGERIKRVGLRVDRLRASLGVGDKLGDHRIVIKRDLAAFADTGIVAHRHAIVLALGGRPIAHQPADRRREIAIRVFGIDAAFDRPAGKFHVALLQSERLAGGDTDHLLDEIDAGNKLGHRMFDLQPCVHLEEIEAAILSGDEFHGAGAVVADRPGERDRLLTHLGARLGVKQRTRRFLDDFLIAALDRALALAQIDDVAVLVAQNLNFDVARIGDEFFDEDAVVAEARFRLRAGAGEVLHHFAFGKRDAHALAAAARGRLDHHRITNLLGDGDGLDIVLDHPEMTGDSRNLGARGGFL